MNRRDFLSIGSVVGATLPLSVLGEESLVKVPDAGDSSVGSSSAGALPVRVAVVGCGRQGRAILNIGLKLPGIRFVAVCDILPSALRSAVLYLDSEDIEVAGFSDFDLLLDTAGREIDVVFVATPDFCHAEQSVAALERGLHVYCESPMANDASGARRMITAAEKNGRLLQIGMERRSDPRYIHAATQLLSPMERDGFLGQITQVETASHRRIQSELVWAERETLPDDLLQRYGYASMREYRNWRHFSRYTHGACWAYLIPQLDVLHWFFGVVPTEIQAAGGCDYYPFGDVLDNLSVLTKYPHPTGTVRGIGRVWTTTSGGGIPSVERIFGIAGSLQMSMSGELWRAHAEPGIAKWTDLVQRGLLKKEEIPPAEEDPNLIRVRETGQVVPYMIPVERMVTPLESHIANFLAAIAGNEALCASARAVWPAHQIAWCAKAALESGERWKIPPEIFHL